MKKTLLILLFTAINIALAQSMGLIERTPVGLDMTGDGWSLSRTYDFVNGREAVKNDLRITSFKTHPQHKHITGYNGDVIIRINLPYAVDTLKAFGEITNYADSAQRNFQLSYSLDGIRYTVLADGSQAAGTCKLKAEQALPANHGLIYLKYTRLLKADDQNGRSGFVLWSNVGFTLNGKLAAAAADKVAQPSKHLKDVFPTGVFWPWERTRPCADYAKLELWDYVDRTMKMLAENGYDTLWFVNIGKGDMLKVLPYAEKNGLQVLFNTDLIDTVYNGTPSITHLENQAWNTYKTIGGSPALLGYIVKDEPMFWETEHMSTFCDLMKEVDPSRDTVATCMNRQSLTYLRDSSLPVVCSDIYYFGAEKSTQLPPPSQSQPELTNALWNIGLAAEQYHKHTWFMAQMFGDAWGRHWRKGDKLVVEPGTYLHWKMPTDAEARWQLWEGLRLGTKGLFFYVLLPPIQLEVPPAEAKTDFERRRVKSMDAFAAQAASWKTQPLVEKQIEIDPGEGMTDMDGSPRPQLLATAPVMKLIRKHEQLLVKRHFGKMPIFYSGDATTDTMTFDSEGRHIGVIVNRDLLSRHDATVLLPPNVTQVTNLATGKDLELTKVSDIFQGVTIPLEAGDGALLEAKFTGRPGISILKEDFAFRTLCRLKINPNAKVERFGNYGMNSRFAVSLKDKSADTTAPVCVMPNLTSSKTGNTIAYNLNRVSKTGILYCQVRGNLTSCKIRAVTNEIGGTKDNFMHLKQADTYDIGKSGDGFVIQDKAFFRPVEVPVGTSALEFYLGSPTDKITDIELWFVQNP